MLPADDALDASTTVPAAPPIPIGVLGQGSGWASTTKERPSLSCLAPTQSIGPVGIRRAAHHRGEEAVGWGSPGSFSTEPPLERKDGNLVDV